jgi:hypothetical protein
MTVSREDVYIGCPSIDGRIFVNCMLSINRCMNYFGQSYFLCGYSDIALARNHIVHAFLKTDKNWLVWIDSDMHFTEQDWLLLWEEGVACPTNPNGDPEDIVTAAYARKIPGAAPANYGLGFTRVHRRVYEAIADLKNSDGAELVGRFYMDGEIRVHYHPIGNSPDARWIGEDRGFFTYAQMTGITHRLETRTRLKHAGYFEYDYPAQVSSEVVWYVPKESNE